VGTISRLLKIIGLFCKRAHTRDDILQKRQYSAKETYNLKEPTNRSHPIPRLTPHYTQAIADRVAQNLQIISENVHFNTMILMGFIMSTI